MFWEQIIVKKEERLLLSRDGRFERILAPGDYHILMASYLSVETEMHSLRDFEFRSIWSGYLLRERPDVIRQHFIRIETNETQIAMVYANGELFRVLPPAKRVLMWRDAASITAELVDVVADGAEAFAQVRAY